MARALTLVERIEAIEEALDLLGPEVSEPVRQGVRDCLAIARERAVLDPDTVLIAFVGATGSGKSSLFNALVGEELAVADVLRPTTSQPLAALPEGHDASALLDWLKVARRVPLPAGARIPAKAVLLDLPDIDSRSQENRAIARLLADRVDMVLWVVDPQKYADDVIHSQWIGPLAKSARATAMVLNQIDLLDEEGRKAVMGHLRSLLVSDGVPDVPVLGVSARTGEGIASLGDVLDAVARTVAATAAKIHGTLDASASAIREDCGIPAALPAVDTRGLTAALAQEIADAAGFSRIADEVGDSILHRANGRIGWLPVKRLSALRADPLRRRRLGSGGGPAGHPGVAVLSAESMGEAEVAKAAASLRRVADELGESRPRSWRRSFRALAREAAESLPDLVDHSISRTRLGDRRDPRWWDVSGGLQLLGWLAVLAGALWILVHWAAKAYLLLPLPLPMWRGLPVPTWLILVGLLVTLLVWGVSRILVGLAARRASRRAFRALADSLAEEVETGVVGPLVAEDARQRRVVEALARASL